MRLIASALGALVLVAGSAAPGAAQTQPKPPPAYAKKAAPQYSAEGQYAARPRGNGYQEQLADKLRFGSSAWWEQMKREGRLGGETP
jgi:hypothetical protein